jgi:hypothetical protein
MHSDAEYGKLLGYVGVRGVCHTERRHVQEDKNFNKQPCRTLKTFSGFKNSVHFDTETLSG